MVEERKDLDLSRAPYPARAHQLVGVRAMVDWDDPESGRVIGGCLFLQDEVGAGKSKQVIDAASILFEQDLIDRVLVVAPPANRSLTWFDPEIGELATHSWPGLPTLVEEYHQRVRRWSRDYVPDGQKRVLRWVVTNYEFLRQASRLETLRPYVNGRTLLVLDESLEVSNHRAIQTKAILSLRRQCRRVVLLNGTPGDPFDLFTQAALLAPTTQGRAVGSRILDVASFTHFRGRYAELGGFQGRQVVRWKNLEDLQRRLAPYVLRRLTSECWDLPPKLPPVALEVTLTPETWAVYREMRDELCVWLDQQTVAVANHAAVKAMRLAQITSGFTGGVLDEYEELGEVEDEQVLADLGVVRGDLPRVRPSVEEAARVVRQQRNLATEGRPAWLPPVPESFRPEPPPVPGVRPFAPAVAQVTGQLPSERAVGREKLDFLIDWVREGSLRDPENFKAIVWCAFRFELLRCRAELEALVQRGELKLQLGAIFGGQLPEERSAGVRLLDPKTTPPGPVVTLATVGAGSRGLNQSGAHRALYLSNNRRAGLRIQSEGRLHRPPQTHPVWYGDAVARGPQGQRTIDDVIVRALRANVDLQNWTCAAWIKALREE
jgi:hypothetical protein